MKRTILILISVTVFAINAFTQSWYAGGSIMYSTPVATRIGIGSNNPGSLLGVGTSSQFMINTTGAITAATGITSSGSIIFSNFTSNGGPLFTNGTGTLSQITAGTTTTVLHGGTTPSFSAISLVNDITGTLPVSNGGTGASTLTGILQGNGTSPITGINGTANYLPKWSSTAPYLRGTSLLYDDGTNVGINTNSPTGLLHLYSGSTSNLVIERNNASGLGGFLVFLSTNYPNNQNCAIGSVVFQAKVSGTAYTGADILANSTAAWSAGNYNTRLDFQTTSASTLSTKMTILNTGNVGIGTTTPSQKLEISHSDATGGIALNQTGTNAKSEIKFNKNGTELWALGNDFNNDGTQTFFIWNQSSGSAPLYINSNGQVGIGGQIPPTTFNGYILYVNSGIVARDVKVTAGTFPDYVFSDDYKLSDIYAVDTFITKNKHLPNLPSAAEVKKNEGFDLGDMQQKLIKTVEEQTLYIISLQKQIDAMKIQMNALINK